MAKARAKAGRFRRLGPEARRAANLGSAYRKATLEAVAETALPSVTFPSDCPWTVEQVLGDGFWPG